MAVSDIPQHTSRSQFLPHVVFRNTRLAPEAEVQGVRKPEEVDAFALRWHNMFFRFPGSGSGVAPHTTRSTSGVHALSASGFDSDTKRGDITSRCRRSHHRSGVAPVTACHRGGHLPELRWVGMFVFGDLGVPLRRYGCPAGALAISRGPWFFACVLSA